MSGTLTSGMHTSGAAAVPALRMTFEEFLAWTHEDVRAEWINGEVIVVAPSNLDHQDLLDFLNDLVKTFARARGLGRVFFAPVLMRLPNRPSGREPDLLFVSTAHSDRLRETYVDGPADLVVEIVSPESDARDRGDKFLEYEAAGIPEYWLIDPLRREAVFYCLGPDGRYRVAGLEAGIYRSSMLPGFTLRVAWLWQRPLPTLADVIGQIGL